ncbi:MAG: class I SAM-dependent methyltransferase [Rhodospirillales bacterium]
MQYRKREDFYGVYDAYKSYQTPVLKAKHVRWYDREFWNPAKCSSSMSVLEIGSGTGEFLAYLKHKGVENFIGVEQDARAVEVMDRELAGHVRVSDVWEFLDGGCGEPFDRVVMLDVLEHFDHFEGAELLSRLKTVMKEDGLLVIRVPNMSSPWGGVYQFGDLTHKAAYTPDSIKQLGLAAGLESVAFLDQRRGSPLKRFTEDCLHMILKKVLTDSREVWTANMIAVMKPAPDGGAGP